MRKGNISKRCMVAIMAAMMAVSSAGAAAAVPMTVYAQTMDDNPQSNLVQEVPNGYEMNNNAGTVQVNNGTINSNTGQVLLNNNIVVNQGGTVSVNFATVNGTGYVTDNYGGSVSAGNTVANQYYSVLFNPSNLGSVAYDPASFSSYNDKQFLKVYPEPTGNHLGSITISPVSGYGIVGDDSENENGTIGYQIARQDNGTYVMTIYELHDNIELTAQQVGLSFQQIEQQSTNPSGGAVTSNTANTTGLDQKALADILAMLNNSGSMTEKNDVSSVASTTGNTAIAKAETDASAFGTVNDGGKIIKNELPAAIMISRESPITGVAFTETENSFIHKVGLKSGGKPFAHVYSIDRAKSSEAYACFDGAAATVGGVVLGGLNIELGYIFYGKLNALSRSVTTYATMKIKDFVPGATYYIARVLPGNQTELIPITVDEYGVFTVEITGGLAAYGLIQA